jgi:hypothetical protein
MVTAALEQLAAKIIWGEAGGRDNATIAKGYELD